MLYSPSNDSAKNSDRFIAPHIPAIFIDKPAGIIYFSAIKVSSGHNRESCVNQERARRCNRGQALQMPLTDVGKAQTEGRSGSQKTCLERIG
jgi:hypothetical protein